MTDTPIADAAERTVINVFGGESFVLDVAPDEFTVPPGDVDPTVVDADAVETPAPDWDDEDADDEDVYVAPSEVVEDPLLTFLDTEDEDA